MRALQRGPAAFLALVAAVLSGGLLLKAASAASVVQPQVVQISLSSGGPSPANASSSVGQTIRWTNNDSVSHTLSGNGFSFGASAVPIDPHGSFTYAFSAKGSFSYDDVHFLFDNPGTVNVTTAVATRPVASASRGPASPASAPAKPGAARPGATPTSGGGSPDSGQVLAPSLGDSVLPSSSPTTIVGPNPVFAAPLPNAPASAFTTGSSPTPTPSTSYADHPLTQGSAHRYGLPALLAVLGITGVGSLLLRLLLAHPAARRDPPAPAP